MSRDRRNQITTAVVIVVVLAGILAWHFVIDPWLEQHRTDQGDSSAERVRAPDRA